MRRLAVNLATRPLRNRRLFLSLAAVLGVAFLVISVAAVVVFLQFSLKKSTVRAALQNADASIRTAQTEQKRTAARVKDALDKDRDVIDTINSIILQKGLSWTDFLSKLEECLPDSSYILSLSIPRVDHTQIQFRIRIVSRSLDDFLALINRLLENKFSQPRLENEEKNSQGQLVSEISVTYERNI